MFRVRRLFWLGLLPLAACAGAGGGGSASGARYAGLSCAPFARALTGVALYGDAGSWWAEADGRYVEAHAPVVGSILVLAAIGRLPHGHVSVVSRVDGPRSIAVVQANWVPGELARDEPVLDVSADNDWSLVRVWYAPIGAMGTHPYPAYGFIVPQRPAPHDALIAAAPQAARSLSGG